MNILLTICARGGSKGLPSKNSRILSGKPLIAHSIDQAKSWGRASLILVSTDSPEIREIANKYGAETPFLRPAELSTDSAGKLPVLSHALRQAEIFRGESFDVVVDLDPTAPIREPEDLTRALEIFLETRPNVCLSVTRARKNPYFNMVERDPASGKIQIVKKLATSVVSRQEAPPVYDINGSIYVYSRDFLLSDPRTVLDGTVEIYEMNPDSAFDIDSEREFIFTEVLISNRARKKNQKEAEHG